MIAARRSLEPTNHAADLDRKNEPGRTIGGKKMFDLQTCSFF
jgi:hypothetical protein